METDDRIISSWNKGLRRETDPCVPESWNKGKTGVFSDETIHKMSEKKLGCIPWNRGLTKETDDRVRIGGEKISISNKGRAIWNEGITNEADERMRKLSEHSTLYLDEKTLYRKYIEEEKTLDQIAIEMGSCRPIVSRELKRFDIPMYSRSALSKRAWADDDYRKEAIIRLARAKGLASPTSYEQKIITLCKDFGFPFKFIGDGREVIEGKVPDFIATDGQKLIIETYAAYWHLDNYEITRKAFFDQYGYKILFLSDNDLNKKEWKDICKMKIEKFMGGGK